MKTVSWYRSPLIWRALIESIAVVLALILPTSRLWENWFIAEQMHFVAIHHGIIIMDLLVSSFQYEGVVVELPPEYLRPFAGTLVAGIGVDITTLFFQIKLIVHDDVTPRDSEHEEYLQLVLLSFITMLSFIRLIIFVVTFRVHRDNTSVTSSSPTAPTPGPQPTRLRNGGGDGGGYGDYANDTELRDQVEGGVRHRTTAQAVKQARAQSGYAVQHE